MHSHIIRGRFFFIFFLATAFVAHHIYYYYYCFFFHPVLLRLLLYFFLSFHVYVCVISTQVQFIRDLFVVTLSRWHTNTIKTRTMQFHFMSYHILLVYTILLVSFSAWLDYLMLGWKLAKVNEEKKQRKTLYGNVICYL